MADKGLRGSGVELSCLVREEGAQQKWQEPEKRGTRGSQVRLPERHEGLDLNLLKM